MTYVSVNESNLEVVAVVQITLGQLAGTITTLDVDIVQFHKLMMFGDSLFTHGRLGVSKMD